MGSPCLLLLPTTHLTSLPHLPLPDHCSCHGVLEPNTLTHYPGISLRARAWLSFSSSA